MNKNIIEEFLRFKQIFSGNAEEEVKKLVASGKVSQQQLNDAQALATQIIEYMK